MSYACLLLCAAKLLANGDMEAMVGTSVAAWRLPKQYSVEDGRGRDGSRGLVWRNADPKAYPVARNRVSVRPGVAYRFGGWVKAVSFGKESDGAALYFDFYDKGGKWVGGLGTNAAHKPGEWTKVEGKTDRAPENAAYGEVLVFCSRQAVGEAVFDDLYVEPLEEEFLGDVWCSAYRNAAAEGMVRFYAEFNEFAPEAKRTDLKMTFRIPRGRFEWIDLKTDRRKGHARAEADISEFRYGMAPVQLWVTTGGVYAASKTVFFERFRGADPRKVHFDSRNRTIVDGKPFFPLGMYTSKVTAEDADLLTRNGFNCVMPYWTGALGTKVLDHCRKVGLKVIPNIKDGFAGERYCSKDVVDEATGEAWVSEQVSRLKDHPAILAWYSCDESELSLVPRLRARQKLLERLDPDHPTWAVLYQADRIRKYMGTFDVIGTDPYPITDLGQYPKATDGIRRAGDWTRQTVEGVFGGDRPVWQVPQAFDWAIIRGTEAERLAAPSRMPTEDEIRNMTWQCLANGANGIIYYCLAELRVMEKRTPFEKAFAAVANVAKEVRAQEAMFLEGTSEQLATGNPGVVARRWTKGGKTLLALVNATEKPQAATVSGERVELKPIEVVLREPETRR